MMERDSRLPRIWKKLSTVNTSNNGRNSIRSSSFTGKFGKRCSTSKLMGLNSLHSSQSMARYCTKPPGNPNALIAAPNRISITGAVSAICR